MGRPDGPPKGGQFPSGMYPPQNQQFPAQNQQGNLQRPEQPRQNSFPPESVLHDGNYPPGEERPPTNGAGAAAGVDTADSGTDSVDGPYYRSSVTESGHYYQRSYSTVEEVTQQTPDYLASFLSDRMRRDGYQVPHTLSARRKGVNSDVARCLQQIGDDLSNNTHLNTLIDGVKVTPGTAFDTFACVAGQIFEDGVINWGRIVTLFYFAYRLALQSVTEIKFIQTIIDWVCRFITGQIAKWISDRGGWTSIKEYFGSTAAQMCGVFLAGCAFMAFVFYVQKK